MHDFYCIMVSAPLTPMVRNVLLHAACDCVAGGIRKKKIVHDDVDGHVKTNFRDELGGGEVTGILFKGDIETKDGKIKVKYLVNPRHIAIMRRGKGHWINLKQFWEHLRKLREANELN